MTHPLYLSKNGAILWEELPEALRLYDNATATGPGDLARFIDGFGHLMDRFEATLAQFHADGFAASLGPADPIAPMQSWVLPYVAELFGVTLFGPDPQSRASELAQAIWIARRRGSRLAIDRAAEAILGRAVVTVPGLSRTLFSPTLRARLLTHRELTGTPHPLDPLILHEPLGPAGTLSNLRRRHAGLPLGLRDIRGHMRAVATSTVRLGSEFRPVTDPVSGVQTLRRFVIVHPDGIPCFAASHEDRALRRPDIRAPRANRPAAAGLSRPDLVWLHVDPPAGLFRPGLIVTASAPVITGGSIQPPAAPLADTLFRPPVASATVTLTPANAHPVSGRHIITGLRLDGELVIATGTHVTLNDCAIRRVTQRAGARLSLSGCLLEEFTADDGAALTRMEYVTVTRRTAARGLFASDCILMDPVFPVAVPAGGSCIRFSRLGPGAALPPWLRLQKTTRGPVPWLNWPCLPDSAGVHTTRVPGFGEPGYGVLSDTTPAAIANGAEDGGEPGVYHAAFHLARLTAAVRRAESYAPAGHRVIARYDLRLAAPLPGLAP